ASSSAIGTVTLAESTRKTSQEVRRATGEAARAAGIGSALLADVVRDDGVRKESVAIQRAKTAAPIAGPNQLTLQSKWAKLFRKAHSVPAAAIKRRGYSHSKPPLAAVLRTPARRMLKNGSRKAAVGLLPAASSETT